VRTQDLPRRRAFSATPRTIDNFIEKLRQKIEREPHQPEFLITIHGIGYTFVG